MTTDRKLVLAALALSLAAAPASLAQESWPGQAPDANVVIQRDGKITTVIVTDESTARMTRLFAELRALPNSSDDEVVFWITQNQLKLPPYFLYEAARRRLATDRAAALTWFLLAGVRARYDALRCADRSAGQNVVMLPQLAPEVAQYAEAHRAESGRAGLLVMQRSDLFAHEASPWWICSQGIRNTVRALEGGRLDKAQWLKPDTEWPAMRTQLAAGLSRYFEEQGKPQDDPIPPSKKQYPVTTLPAGWNYGAMGWVDQSTLAVRTARRGSTGSPNSDSLQVWNRARGLTPVAQNVGHQLCAGQGHVAYVANVVRSKFEPGKLQRIKLTAMVGPPERLERFELDLSDMLTPAYTEQNGGTSWTKRAQGNPYKQSGIDCRWAAAPRIAPLYAQSHWQPLLPGHGFIGFKPANNADDVEAVFHADENAEGRPLGILWPGLQDRCVRYYAFRKAYFVSVCGLGDGAGARLLRETCLPGWWFDPEGARVEKTCGPIDSATKDMTAYEPTRAGLLRLAKFRRTYHGMKPGGLYLTDAQGRTERIYTHQGAGWLEDARVAPDGCQVAFREIMGTRVSDPWQVRILQLC